MPEVTKTSTTVVKSKPAPVVKKVEVPAKDVEELVKDSIEKEPSLIELIQHQRQINRGE